MQKVALVKPPTACQRGGACQHERTGNQPATSLTRSVKGRGIRSVRAAHRSAALKPRGAKPRRKKVHTLGIRFDQITRRAFAVTPHHTDQRDAGLRQRSETGARIAAMSSSTSGFQHQVRRLGRAANRHVVPGAIANIAVARGTATPGRHIALRVAATPRSARPLRCYRSVSVARQGAVHARQRAAFAAAAPARRAAGGRRRR